jgi:cell wall-associated NlpC family hydrolase
MRANALHEVGEDYVWGAEGEGGVDGNDDYDCSGFIWRMYDLVGVKLQRTTADGYYHMSHRIARPGKVGDMFVMLDSHGQARHIGLYVGRGQTVEARGKAYGVVRSSVDRVNDRGARWIARFYPLGELSSTTTYPTAILRRGDTGKLVATLQWWLNAYAKKMHWTNLRPLFLDGEFGPLTESMVRKAQKSLGVTVDGVVGPITWKALIRATRG